MQYDRRTILGALAAGAGGLALARPASSQESRLFSGEKVDDTVVLRSPSGASILRYVRDRLPEGEKGPSVEGGCFTHPIYTPQGEVVTDLAPADHPHHRGVFCGWVEME